MRYLLACLLLAGCTATYTPVEKPSEPAAADNDNQQWERLGAFGPFMRPVEMDGHRFIVTYKGDSLSVLHSPACKCQKGGQHAN